jgi:hypothetical protein
VPLHGASGYGSEPIRAGRRHTCVVTSTRRAVNVCVALLVVCVGGCSSGGGTQSSSPTTTHNGSASTSGNAAPQTALTLSETSLRAHEGVGLPRGWAPVDAGDARLWMPAKWTLEYGYSCVGSPPETDVVYVGLNSLANCEPPGQPLPQQAAAFMPSLRTHGATVHRTVNGFRVYSVNEAKPNRVWNVYDVPQLRVRIALRGALAPRILDTLAPSSRKVAVAFATRPGRDDLRPVSEQGVRLSIPSTWTVVTAKYLGCTGPIDELQLVRPGMGAPGCGGGSVGTIADVEIGGGSLSTYPSNSRVFGPGRVPIAVLHHKTTTITIFGLGDGQGSLSLVVQVRLTGSSLIHVLNLGLSRDGRTDGGILASIEATA